MLPERTWSANQDTRDLALAAGEAAEADDVRVGVDDRRGRGRLAGDRERAAAVGLDVLERGGQRLGVAAEGAAARTAAAAPEPPERRRRCRSRPPGRSRAPFAPAGEAAADGRRGGPPRPPPPGPPPKPPPALAGPPAGNVPLVAWPSVWKDQAAGAIRSVAIAVAIAALRSRAGTP